MKEIAQRYRDSYRGMYYAACAITGSERAAERALVSAMIDGRGDDLERVKRHALAELEEGRGEPRAKPRCAGRAAGRRDESRPSAAGRLRPPRSRRTTAPFCARWKTV